MNASHTHATLAPRTPVTVLSRSESAPHSQASRYRERDFGIGYGNSSGYGCEEHYVRPWGADRFRCV